MTKGLHRKIRIVTRGSAATGGEARAVVEDDFHHFRVGLTHAGGVITTTLAQSPRHPFSTCPLAADRLHDLIGKPLSPIAQAVYGATDAATQCTHMLELAGLAAAAAARDIPRRTYEITTPDRTQDRTEPRLKRDGQDLLAWTVEGQIILGPPPFCDVSLRQGFARWALAKLDPDLAEAALVLRRGVTISIGRTRDLDAEPTARPLARCFTEQPERAPSALRMKGSAQEFTGREEQLTADDADWLAWGDGEPVKSAAGEG